MFKDNSEDKKADGAYHMKPNKERNDVILQGTQTAKIQETHQIPSAMQQSFMGIPIIRLKAG